MSYRTLTLLPLLVLAAAGCDSTTSPPAAVSRAPLAARAHAGVTVSVFGSGLEFPRGIAFAPNGDLYVGEAGLGGTYSTAASGCTQVVPPIGPYAGGTTARISRIDAGGNRITVADGFPSAINAVGDVMGVSAVAFIGNRLYALLGAGGCDHGSPDVPSGVALVNPDGSWQVVADLTAYLATHPSANVNPGDFEPSGTWYSMIRSGATFVALEPNHGELARIDPHTGVVRRIVDISKSQGHIVPTVVAEHGGAYYVGNLGDFPVEPGTEKILRITRNGQLSVAAEGFTMVLGLDFDRSGRMYVLESVSVPGFPTPNTGRVVRVDRQGRRDVILDGLNFPTALRFGPDGRLYISNVGYGPPSFDGQGQILRVEVPGANTTTP